MTNRNWIGGHDGNDAGLAANWSPTGAPQPGDNLTVVTGTLEIGPNNLAGNVLHLNDALISGGDLTGNGAPVVLDLNGGGARAAIDGTLNFGDDLTVNATGQDYLDATGGFQAISGSINLADHAHLFVTGGRMQFAYSGSINGGIASKLTNYGTIEMTNAHVSSLINGDGTLAFDAYHNGRGFSEISSPITSAQTVVLNPLLEGVTLTLDDPADFHALLRINPEQGGFSSSVVLNGVHADSFAVFGDRLLLTNGGMPVDMLRVANAGVMPITASYGTNAVTLTFQT